MPENPQPSADDAQNARPSPCLACAVSYDCANKMGIDRRHAKDKRLCRRAAFIIRDVYLCKARRVQYSCHCNAPPRTHITHSLGLSNCTTHTPRVRVVYKPVDEIRNESQAISTMQWECVTGTFHTKEWVCVGKFDHKMDRIS